MTKQPKMKKSGLKPGDKVIMHNCYEVVRLEGYGGGFATEYLKK
ncbi:MULTISPECIES: hypothetical protein [Paenibacillus]|nr:hypothetical protein [Paenibacillus borealis]